MEQREPDVEAKALMLTEEFATKFRSIHYTFHPPDIPGESAGKGSNVAWAARKLSERYPMEQRRDVIITGIDGEWPTFEEILNLRPCVAHAVFSISLWKETLNDSLTGSPLGGGMHLQPIATFRRTTSR